MKPYQSFIRVPYETPEMQSLPLNADSALCQTSLGGGEIQPGTGDNWGTF